MPTISWSPHIGYVEQTDFAQTTAPSRPHNAVDWLLAAYFSLQYWRTRCPNIEILEARPVDLHQHGLESHQLVLHLGQVTELDDSAATKIELKI